MAGDWTAERIGQYDQSRTAANADLDLLVETLRIRRAEVGERQAMAEIAKMVSDSRPEELGGLLMAALLRLAG